MERQVGVATSSSRAAAAASRAGTWALTLIKQKRISRSFSRSKGSFLRIRHKNSRRRWIKARKGVRGFKGSVEGKDSCLRISGSLCTGCSWSLGAWWFWRWSLEAEGMGINSTHHMVALEVLTTSLSITPNSPFQKTCINKCPLNICHSNSNTIEVHQTFLQPTLQIINQVAAALLHRTTLISNWNSTSMILTEELDSDYFYYNN